MNMELNWINVLSNVSAMGLLAYLVIFGIPKLITAARATMKEERDTFNQEQSLFLAKLDIISNHVRDLAIEMAKSVEIERVINEKLIIILRTLDRKDARQAKQGPGS